MEQKELELIELTIKIADNNPTIALCKATFRGEGKKMIYMDFTLSKELLKDPAFRILSYVRNLGRDSKEVQSEREQDERQSELHQRDMPLQYSRKDRAL